MSAPNTNVEKQTKRHKTPLLGMGGAVIFATILFVGLLFWISANGNEPEGAETQVEVVPGAGATEELTDG